MYNYIPTNSEKKFSILENQVFLYSIIFMTPEPNKFYTSPFREDNNPSCYFQLFNGKLIFIDWGENKNRIHRDIFSFTNELYQFDFIESLNYLYSLLDGENPIKYNMKFREKNDTIVKQELKIQKKYFTEKDIRYWKQYHLSLKDVVNTNGNFKVTSISKFSIANTIIIPDSVSYAYIFDNGIKTYIPYSKNYKWRNNLSKDDIGISSKKYNTLYITKAAKDALLLNKLKKDYIFFQSENSFPNDFILSKTIKSYKNINILFDNDRAGQLNSTLLFYFIKNNFKTKNVKKVFTNVEKDITDFSKRFGINASYDYLKQNGIP